MKGHIKRTNDVIILLYRLFIDLECTEIAKKIRYETQKIRSMYGKSVLLNIIAFHEYSPK